VLKLSWRLSVMSIDFAKEIEAIKLEESTKALELEKAVVAQETARAAAMQKKLDYLSQPGYVWALFFNRNCPFNPTTGHLSTVNGVKAVNGAPELPEGFGMAMKAWTFGAEQYVAKHANSGFKLEYFIPASFLESDSDYPITEAGSLVNVGGKTGLQYQTPDGDLIVLGRNEPVDASLIPVQEYIFKAYLKMGFMPKSDSTWDPLARNIFAGISSDAIAAKLSANSQRFASNQTASLNSWRVARSTNNVASELANAANALPTTDAPKAKRGRVSV
jgi:hypothetical protein